MKTLYKKLSFLNKLFGFDKTNNINLNSNSQHLYNLSHIYEVQSEKLKDQEAEIYELRQLCIELTRAVDKTIPEKIDQLTERVENALSASYTAYDPIVNNVSELQKAHVALNNTVVNLVNKDKV